MGRCVRITVIAACLAVSGCGRVGDLPERQEASPPDAVSPSPTYLPPDERWAPPTHREGDALVMPVTFPDGTSAELVYPQELRLEDMSVYPDTFAEIGGPSECGSPVYATRHDPHGTWITGDASLAEHVRPDGVRVGLWEGTRANRPYDFLIFRFGAWTVMIPCRGSIGDAELAIWAENLHGHQSPEGLLVLEGTAPLVVNPWRDQNGPTLRMSDEDIIVDIQPGSELCEQSSGRGGDTDPGDGVVQWCIQPEGSVYVYANGFTPAGEDFLQQLVDGLQVRRVQWPD